MNNGKNRNFVIVFVFLSLLIGWPVTADLYLLPRSIFFFLGVSYLFYTQVRFFPGRTVLRYTIGFLVFVVWQFLSCTWALNPAEGLLPATLNLSCLLLFIVCASNKEILVLVVKTASAAVFYVILVGLVQLIQVKSFAYADLAVVTGLNANKNFFCGILFMALPLHAFALLDNPQKRFKWMLWWNCAASLFLITVLQTRAVWLGFTVAVLILSMLYLIKLRTLFSIKKIALGAFVVAAIISTLLIFNKSASQAIGQRLSFQKALTGESSAERLKVWSNSLQLIKDHPFTGVGEGNWQYNFLKYGIRDIPSVQQRFTVFQAPHNDYLWIAAETGIPGLLLFLVLLLTPALICLRILFSSGGDKIKAAICFSFLLGYLVYSFFDFPRYRVEHSFMLTLVFCYAFSLENKSEEQESIKWMRLFFWPVFIFVCVFFVFRTKGEYYARQLVAARAKQQTDKIIKYAENARSAFYTCDPTGIPLEWYLGHAYNMARKPDLAYNCFLKASEQSPYNFYMLGDLAAAELLKQQYPRAEAHLLEAVRINDKYAEGYFNLATLYFYQSDFKKALFYAEKTPPSEKRDFFIKTITTKQKEAPGI